MKKGFIVSFILTLTLTIYRPAMAEIQLPAIFGDNMVLQQQTNVSIWGTGSVNKTVMVKTSWNGKSYETKSDSDGKWKIKVKTSVAGGPFSITISDGTDLTLKNVLIGEVWICSGQSNMYMTMKGYINSPVKGANRAIATSRNEKIRLMTIKRDKSLNPKSNFDGAWMECNPDNVANFSAVAYYFGSMLQQALNVPVGLISSSWGGTQIEPWMSEHIIKQFDWLKLPDNNIKENFSVQTPTVLYNAMISPMVGYAIAGVIWYQGEANRKEPNKYEKMLLGLIQDWRDHWGINFPFYYCQIAPFDYGDIGLNSAYIREAQLNASTLLPNIGMACLMDVGEKKNIHPTRKAVVGERLAYLALSKTYGMESIEYSGPVLKQMRVEGRMVYLTFEHAENGLTTFGKELTHFTIAGKNRYFRPATAAIIGNEILLYSSSVSNPVSVRYAFDDFVAGELFNTEGLPASSFRTDKWEISKK